MPRKSQKNIIPTDALRQLDADELATSMILYINNEDERVYLHPFESDVHALEFLEIMVAGLRADVLEQIMKRSLN